MDFRHTMFGRFISMLVMHMCSCAFAADAFPCLGDKLCRYTCLRALFLCLQGRRAFPSIPAGMVRLDCLPFAVQGALEYPRHLDLVSAAYIDLEVLIS